MNPLERLRAARLHAHRSAPTVDALLGSIVGLHSTDYASPYLSAWARVPGFDAAALRARLDRGDGLFRVNAFRNTVHVVRAPDLAAVLAATGPAVAAVGRKSPGLKARTDAEIDAGVDTIVAALADGPLDNAALKRARPGLGEDLRYWLMIAMGRGLVLRADGPGARSNRTRYVLAASRVPGLALPPAADARRALLQRAVEAFGPVTVDDLAWWLPAPKREVTAALASAGAALRSLTADGDTWWFPADLGDAPRAPARAARRVAPAVRGSAAQGLPGPVVVPRARSPRGGVPPLSAPLATTLRERSRARSPRGRQRVGRGAAVGVVGRSRGGALGGGWRRGRVAAPRRHRRRGQGRRRVRRRLAARLPAARAASDVLTIPSNEGGRGAVRCARGEAACGEDFRVWRSRRWRGGRSRVWAPPAASGR